MKVTCLMMQKNEHQLLEPWILYHGLHFGFENLVVYDNGSTLESVVTTLEKYQALGVNVQWTFGSKSDFENKGLIFSEEIKRLDSQDPSDFYFPMDCDEFVVVEKGHDEVKCDSLSIFTELARHEGGSAPLVIGAAFDNSPLYNNYFYRTEGQRKTFFTKGTCRTLDLGFHDGKTHSKESAVKTKVCYVHFHYKSFTQYAESAMQKLEGRIKDFSKNSLKAFSKERLAGFHLVGPLLDGRDHYYQSHFNRFQKHSKNYRDLRSFSLVIGNLGLDSAKSSIELHEAFEQKAPRWQGYVDAISIKPGKIEINGWIATLYELDFNNIVLSVSGCEYLIESFKKTERQDVVNSVKYASSKPGIEMVFDVGSVDSEFDLKDVAIYLKDFGNRFNFAISDRVFR